MTQANPVTFEATPTLVGNKVKWKLCHMNPPTAPIPNCGESNGTYPRVNLDPDAGPYVFQYRIVNDQTGKGIKFADGALVIKKGEPFGPGKEKQIGDIAKGTGDKVLSFVDMNSLPNDVYPANVVITYGLHFTDQAGVPVTSIDPDITNGGNPGMYQPDTGVGLVDPESGAFWALLAMMFVASLAAMLVVRMLKSGR